MINKNQGISLLTLILFLTALLPAVAQDGAKLIEYIIYQEFDKAKELIKGGVDVDYQDEYSGSTALILSCGYNFVDMAKFLIEHGANLNLQDRNGQTALMAAARCCEELFNLLLAKGAEIKLKDENEHTALTHACVGVISEDVSLAVVQTLLDRGANVDEAPDSGPAGGYTCLMMAAVNNQLELVKLLAKNGADVNKKAKDGNSALSLAKEENNEEMVKLLKSLGAKDLDP